MMVGTGALQTSFPGAIHIDTAMAVHRQLLREERPEAKKDLECRRAPSFNRGFIIEEYKKRG